MKAILQRIKEQWNWSDTTVAGSNAATLGLFIGNCWWESLWVAYGASLLALTAQIIRARWSKDILHDALIFGAIVGWTWPLGEYILTQTLGWWGEYVATGAMVLDTPVHMVLISWLTSSYCFYVGRRVTDMGGTGLYSALASGSSAFVIGLVGENLAVAAQMWEYIPASVELWSVPAFIPLSYGVAYLSLPLWKRYPVVLGTIFFMVVLFVTAIGLGIAEGFFPRI